MKKNLILLLLLALSGLAIADNGDNGRPCFPNDPDPGCHAGGTGPQGPPGPQGPAGPAGPQGPIGPQGPAGVKGDKGDKGDTGAAGPKGDKGDTGAPGAQGAIGPAGPEGPAGPSGSPGAQGPAGPQGAAGAQGPAGAQGSVGPQGPAGPSADSNLKYFYHEYAVAIEVPAGKIVTIYAGRFNGGLSTGGGCTLYEGSGSFLLFSSMPVFYNNPADNPYNGANYVQKLVFGLPVETVYWNGWKCEYRNTSSQTQTLKARAHGLAIGGISDVSIPYAPVRADELTDVALRGLAGTQ